MELPTTVRAVAFFDGQNLFYAAKKAFGYSYPNFDPIALASMVCRKAGWELAQTRFYTGIPDATDNPVWHSFWSAKLLSFGRQPNTYVFTRTLRYRNQSVHLPDGTSTTILVGQEKGVDVRIALDLVRLGRDRHYDVGLIFSQDQDLTEAVEEVREISSMQGRYVKLACAFPVSPTLSNRRGVDKTDWIRVTRQDYDQCLDPRDYRPRRP